MNERRRHFRRRTLLNGRVEIPKLADWSVDCAVRNLSEGGARLAVPAAVVVPDRVGLTISDRPRRPARLVWYRDGQAGFALDDEPATDARRQDAGANDRLAARIAAITGRPRPEADFTRP